MIRSLLLSAALLGCSRHQAPAPTTIDSVTIAAEPDFPPDVKRALAIKDEAIARCETGGGIVAMGFSYVVVCIKPQCVEWTRDPHVPEGR